MISEKNKEFTLHTKNTSYLFRVNATNHLEHLYYGRRINSDLPLQPLYFKNTLPLEHAIAYNEEHPTYSLNNICLEYSFYAKGDYRESALLYSLADGNRVADFLYKEHRIIKGKPRSFANLPESYGNSDECSTLIVVLSEKSALLRLELIYSVFEQTDVITRRVTLTNEGQEKVDLRRIASLQLDLPVGTYDLITFDGAWGRERHRTRTPLRSGIHVNDSKTGSSSHFHNPALFLAEQGCTEFHGNCYGCNLIYSGDHAQSVEVTERRQVRLLTGLNPATFGWQLFSGEKFSAPEAILTFSHEGLNGASGNFHRFINSHIIRAKGKHFERPVLFNNWQATYFNFTAASLLKLAKAAADLGIELFVLDDGWFASREDESTSLGDWFTNTKKFPEGIADFSKKIHSLGLLFGLYCEPEMVSRKSQLFKEHPDWLVGLPNSTPAVGRSQYILDFTNSEVRDYLFDTLSTIWKVAKVDYVKWDMNRTFSDMYSLRGSFRQDEFNHRYMLGLYALLQRFVEAFPNILFEGSASGGGRFDLGILCYMSQALVSENSDPFSRLAIQEGSSYAYPLSTMANRVADSPSHQTLRNSSLESRFNVAAFGLLGYEVDLLLLSKQEKATIERQIAFYKSHRALFQYGEFFRLEPTGANRTLWAVTNRDRTEMLVLLFQQHAHTSAPQDILKVPIVDVTKVYTVAPRLEYIDIRSFGTLLNKYSPIKIKNDGALQRIVSEKIALENEVEFYTVGGDLLAYHGIVLNQQFTGEGYDQETRVMGDFSGRLYHIKAKE